MDQIERKKRKWKGNLEFWLRCEECNKKIMKWFWMRKKHSEKTDRDYVVLCDDCWLRVSDNVISMYFRDKKDALDLNWFSKI
jgi:hypothetical protein